MRRILALTAVLALALVGVTGCGDNKPDPRAKYVKDVNTIQSDYANQVNTIATQITTTSTKEQDNEAIKQIRVATIRVAARLAALKAPSEVAAESQVLSQQLSALSKQLDGNADSIKAQSTALEAALKNLNSKL